jgi:hypothetical protein
MNALLIYQEVGKQWRTKLSDCNNFELNIFTLYGVSQKVPSIEIILLSIVVKAGVYMESLEKIDFHFLSEIGTVACNWCCESIYLVELKKLFSQDWAVFNYPKNTSRT